jgi:dolichol-phosphate mannosyltransferase
MGTVTWELIVVDDDSPDGTWREALLLGSEGLPVRCIRRIGRRGLSSAVVEGVMSASGEFVAVIDADMQHDETRLIDMLQILQTTETELVVASRYVEGGTIGAWDGTRARLSTFATACSRVLIGKTIKDPMSGFFMTRRAVFDELVGDLSQQGYKILLDVLTTARRPLRVVEIPYVFRERVSGESKLDAIVVAEYLLLLIEKFSRGFLPPRFILFSMVGGLGLIVHLSTLRVLQLCGSGFLEAQTVATLVAMTFNFMLNNLTTYRSERLRGAQALVGYIIFCATCSLGAIANLGVANFVIGHFSSWAFAGAAGAIMSAVFNFSLSTRFVWGRATRQREARARVALDKAACLKAVGSVQR